MSESIFRVLNPAPYHGSRKKPPFFEGWYYKLVTADGQTRIAVIPAVILGDQGHAFIQVVDSSTARMGYHAFPLDTFSASEKNFEMNIGDNHFTLDGFDLDLDGDQGRVSGSVRVHERNPWPVKFTSPGVMGWYAWVPGMECYHGVLSLDHAISGSLTIDGRLVDFDGGRGYMEKDWGASFPEGYLWMQTNHFSEPGTSLMASVAVIPWRSSSFPGFIMGLLHQGRLHRFATYTGARVEALELNAEQVLVSVRDRRLRLELRAERSEGIPLKGPTRQDMGMRVDESLSARVHVRLSTLDGSTLFEDTGRHAGLEIVNPERLLEEIGVSVSS